MRAQQRYTISVMRMCLTNCYLSWSRFATNATGRHIASNLLPNWNGKKKLVLDADGAHGRVISGWCALFEVTVGIALAKNGPCGPELKGIEPLK